MSQEKSHKPASVIRVYLFPFIQKRALEMKYVDLFHLFSISILSLLQLTEAVFIGDHLDVALQSGYF